MSIAISEDHRELAEGVRAWAASLQGVAAARAAEGEADAAFSDGWKAVTEMGLVGIAVSEDLGGGGGDVLDLAVALEAAAGELVAGPLLGPAVVATVLARSGAPESGGLLATLLAGSVAAPVMPGPDGPVAWDAPSAEHLLVEAEDGWRLLATDDLEVRPATGLDLSRRFGTLGAQPTLQGAPLTGVDHDLVRRTAVTLAAAEASGVARWCLRTAVEYAGVREQFGRKIGAFQAVKHLCVEMLETAEAVTAAAWDAAAAATAAAGGSPESVEQWAYAADVAEVTCFDGAVEIAKTCIQVLGGIGFTHEHDAHLHLRRAMALRALLGRSDDAALRLTDRACAGVRRRVTVDLGGRDAAVRPDVRAEAERLADLPAQDLRAALVDTGLLMPHWPAPYGRGADAVEQVVIDEELARAGVERPDIVIAGWALPTIIAHGTPEQQERFVRPSLLGELVWCQLFSEPGAGSDLASLRTRAVKVDGGWRLSGQKVWNSVAERADWGICLARTDPDVPQHKGITYFLVDMKHSEGIDVRPLREITGEALFNEVFLDDVFVPDDCVVAEPGDGWRLARTTLANERVAMAATRLSTSTERAVELVGAPDGASVPDRVAVGRSVALSTVCSLLGVRSTLRSLSGQGPGAESSVAKLLGVRNRQDGSELVVRLQQERLVLTEPAHRVPGQSAVAADVWEMLNTRCLSIAGGTTQILRNVAGERILGLPR